jgi:hypothetical protein
MKYAFILITFTLFILIAMYGQIAGRYPKRDGFCSASIVLLPNGIYNIESGCYKDELTVYEKEK